MSLFPGLGYAAGYKILQRIYKFGGQPFFYDALNANAPVKSAFTNTLGDKNGKAVMHAAAGRCVSKGSWLSC